MKIKVTDDDGTTAFEYDTAKGSECVCPGVKERPAVQEALIEALSFLDISARPEFAGMNGDRSREN